jgi:aspartyl/asparaginyl beta-hydroxylase (cupin superfamily)
MIQYAKLQVPLDIDAIRQEVDALTKAWVPHFNAHHYEGNWSVLSLRSTTGDASQIIPDLHEQLRFMDTALLSECPCIKALLQSFQCELMAVRLMNLQAGSVIKPHKDAELCFEKGEARVHIPIVTNDGVSFFSEDKLVRMQEGECWYINVNLRHSVSNEGSTDRIHLVIDCEVNEWLKELFQRAEIVMAKEENNPEETRKIINELRNQNTEISLQLASQLELQLLSQ